MQLWQSFRYVGEDLHCEETPLVRVAKECGTPCYVYSSEAIRRNFQSLTESFQQANPLICYAVKANANLAVLRLLQAEGSGFDIVSAGELRRVLLIGGAPEKIVFSGVGKSEDELTLALREGLFCIQVESVQEVRQLAETARRMGRTARISIRVNPDVSASTHPYIATGKGTHKFGVDREGVREILSILNREPSLELMGVGAHIGSQILDSAPYVRTFRKLRALADTLRSQGFPIHHIDGGGGFGIPYRHENAGDWSEYAQVLAEEKGDYRVILEPGRFITGNAGVLLTRIVLNKVNRQSRFTVVDAAMNDLIRPALYQAEHDIWPVRRRPGASEVVSDIVGPVCETADFLARSRTLQQGEPGDLLAVLNAGAYGFVASSNYNGRPRPPETLVEGKAFRLVRKRETFEDQIRGEA